MHLIAEQLDLFINYLHFLSLHRLIESSPPKKTRWVSVSLDRWVWHTGGIKIDFIKMKIIAIFVWHTARNNIRIKLTLWFGIIYIIKQAVSPFLHNLATFLKCLFLEFFPNPLLTGHRCSSGNAGSFESVPGRGSQSLSFAISVWFYLSCQSSSHADEPIAPSSAGCYGSSPKNPGRN